MFSIIRYISSLFIILNDQQKIHPIVALPTKCHNGILDLIWISRPLDDYEYGEPYEQDIPPAVWNSEKHKSQYSGGNCSFCKDARNYYQAYEVYKIKLDNYRKNINSNTKNNS